MAAPTPPRSTASFFQGFGARVGWRWEQQRICRPHGHARTAGERLPGRNTVCGRHRPAGRRCTGRRGRCWGGQGTRRQRLTAHGRRRSAGNSFTNTGHESTVLDHVDRTLAYCMQARFFGRRYPTGRHLGRLQTPVGRALAGNEQPAVSACALVRHKAGKRHKTSSGWWRQHVTWSVSTGW